ncbi:hypothetical protein OG21DRAFT_734614 [Imleria badia]|nr:hypothetical protein OG21DRAFT_734614 [Imleria badia]
MKLDTFPNFPVTPAPRLKNLKIWMGSHSLEWSSALFNGDTPALRTLELSYCSLPWYSFKLGGLTILNLDRVHVRFRQSMGEFLTTLSCMQDLNHLYLDTALGSAAGFLSSAAFKTFRKFNLPCLSRLWVVAPLSTVIALLSCVNIPLKTEVRLRCYPESGPSPNDYAPLPSLLARRFDMSDDQVPVNPKIHSLVVASTTLWGNGNGLEFCGSEWDCDYIGNPSDDQWGCNIPLKIVVRFGHPRTGDRDRLITNICCSVPLTNVQNLHVIDPPFSSAFWRKTFGHLRDLRYLKLSHGDMPDIASILSLTPLGHTENQGIYADEGPNQIFAPALEVLELDTIKFPPMPPPAHDMDWPTVVTDVQSLYDALSGRKES